MNVPKYRTYKLMVPINRTRKHEILNICGERSLDLFLEDEIGRFGTDIVRPIAGKTVDGWYEITNNHFIIDAAAKRGESQVEVSVVDCHVNEIPGLINYVLSFPKEIPYQQHHKLMCYLKKWRTTTAEGRLYFNRLPGKDTRAKLWYLLKFKSSQLNRISAIGKYAPHLFRQIEEGMGIEAAYKAAIAIKNGNEKEKAANARVPEEKRAAENAPTQTRRPFGLRTATTTGGSTFDAYGKSQQIVVNDPSKVHASTSTGAPTFNAPTVVMPFRPKLTTLNMTGIGTIEVELVGDDFVVSLNGVRKEGFKCTPREGKETKQLDVTFQGRLVVSFAINSSLLN